MTSVAAAPFSSVPPLEGSGTDVIVTSGPQATSVPDLFAALLQQLVHVHAGLPPAAPPSGPQKGVHQGARWDAAGVAENEKLPADEARPFDPRTIVMVAPDIAVLTPDTQVLARRIEHSCAAVAGGDAAERHAPESVPADRPQFERRAPVDGPVLPNEGAEERAPSTRERLDPDTTAVPEMAAVPELTEHAPSLYATGVSRPDRAPEGVPIDADATLHVDADRAPHLQDRPGLGQRTSIDEPVVPTARVERSVVGPKDPGLRERPLPESIRVADSGVVRAPVAPNVDEAARVIAEAPRAMDEATRVDEVRAPSVEVPAPPSRSQAVSPPGADGLVDVSPAMVSASEGAEELSYSPVSDRHFDSSTDDRRAHGGAPFKPAVRVAETMDVAQGLAVSSGAVTTEVAKARVMPPPEPLKDVPLENQIVQAVRLQWRNGVGDARLTLQPEYLGEVAISLRVEGDCVIATLQADEPHVRVWMQNHEPFLREGLAEQGLVLSRLIVLDESASKDLPGEDRHPPQQQPPPRRQGRRPAPLFDVNV